MGPSSGRPGALPNRLSRPSDGDGVGGRRRDDQEWLAHQAYSWSRVGLSRAWASMVPMSSLSSVVHATRGRPSRRPQNTVPWGVVGLAGRRHGPGDHSPRRQLSADILSGSDSLSFQRFSRSRAALEICFSVSDVPAAVRDRDHRGEVNPQRHPPLTHASGDVRA